MQMYVVKYAQKHHFPLIKLNILPLTLDYIIHLLHRTKSKTLNYQHKN